MVVLDPLSRFLAQTETIQQLIIKQQLLALCMTDMTKHSLTSREDALPQLLPMPPEHELIQLRNTSSVLLDLLLGSGVQDGQPGVHVPFVAVDAQRDVDLDVLDPAHVPRYLPRELAVGEPRRAHGQKRRVRHCLCVGCDAVVHFGCKLDVFASQAGEDALDEGEGGV